MSTPLPQAGGSYYALKDGTLQKAKWPQAQPAEVEKTQAQPAEVEKTQAQPAEKLNETKEAGNGK